MVWPPVAWAELSTAGWTLLSCVTLVLSMWKRVVLLVALVACLFGAAVARRGPGMAMQGREDVLSKYWHSMDLDGDGFATKAEMVIFFSKVFGHSVREEQVRGWWRLQTFVVFSLSSLSLYLSLFSLSSVSLLSSQRCCFFAFALIPHLTSGLCCLCFFQRF